MTARVLIVDDILANIKLLQARLTAEYFEVITATNGHDALEICAQGNCDIVLLDVMMPGIDGFEVCRRLKGNPQTAFLPVVMVTALDQASDRVQGLEAGADDFLTKPVNDVALLTRVKSLVRLKMLTDELAMRTSTTRELGLDEVQFLAEVDRKQRGKVLLVDDRRSSYERIANALSVENDVDLERDAQEALFRAADDTGYELVVVSLDLQGYDALRLCSQLRSLERTRLLPILLVIEADDEKRLIRGLDIGVNDYLQRPIDKNEMRARVKTQIRRKRFTDKLRDSVHQTMEMAVTDALTGLHNRRYLENHLASLVDQAINRRKALSLVIVDIDHFKSINDTHGHDVGDEVLREFAGRIRKNIRGIDLACRFGGEEFVIVMPETDSALAFMVAERLRERIADEPFMIAGGAKTIDVTISIGLSALTALDDTPASMLKRADEALYAAKRSGRNKVVCDEAA